MKSNGTLKSARNIGVVAIPGVTVKRGSTVYVYRYFVRRFINPSVTSLIELLKNAESNTNIIVFCPPRRRIKLALRRRLGEMYRTCPKCVHSIYRITLRERTYIHK